MADKPGSEYWELKVRKRVETAHSYTQFRSMLRKHLIAGDLVRVTEYRWRKGQICKAKEYVVKPD